MESSALIGLLEEAVPGVFDAVPTGGTANVQAVVVELEDFSVLGEMVEQAHAVQQGPSIEDADVIVAGGRGLGEPEHAGTAIGPRTAGTWACRLAGERAGRWHARIVRQLPGPPPSRGIPVDERRCPRIASRLRDGAREAGGNPARSRH